MRLCIGLSSIPADSVAESFQEVKALAGHQGRSFLNYLEKTYVKPNALFPPQYWAGVITAKGGHSTSNICESFHTHLGRLFGVGNYHPNIYTFMENLNIYHALAEIKFFSAPAVSRAPHRNTQLLNEFQEGKIEVINFLKAITTKRNSKKTLAIATTSVTQHRYGLRSRTQN